MLDPTKFIAEKPFLFSEGCNVLEVNKIYNEDCRETIQRMDNDSIDCLVTSPPYWGLRDYGDETIAIWDAVNGCLHEWKDKNIKKINSNFNESFNERWGNAGGQKKQEDARPKEISQGQYCQKCGAWRGSLGLEPDFRLYIKHLVEIFEMFKPKLKKAGTIWVNLGDTYASGTRDNSGIDNTRLNSKEGKHVGEWHEQPNRKLKNYPAKSLCCVPDRFKIAMIDAGWICRNEIIWHKPNCMPSSVKDRFTVDFEKIYFFTKSSRYYFEQQIDGKHKLIRKATKQGHKQGHDPNRKSIGIVGGFSKDIVTIGRNKRCVWTITTKGSPEAHFAIYPDMLPATPIKAGCPPCGIVYDPFGGSGTTAEVALRLDRNFIISEISLKYVSDISEKRIKIEQSKLRLF